MMMKFKLFLCLIFLNFIKFNYCFKINLSSDVTDLNLKSNLISSDLNLPKFEKYKKFKKYMLKLKNMNKHNRIKWPNGIVYYKFDQKLKPFHITSILNAIKSIELNSCVRFKKWRSFNQSSDYVKIIKSKGCYSNVGRIGGMQHLSLGEGCYSYGIITHELLHVIGFHHHHMRSDRDLFLNIFHENIDETYDLQFEKLSKIKSNLFTPFDYKSIMIYGEKAFSKNNKPTMTAKQPGVRLTFPSKKKRMTKYDIDGINKLYNCKQHLQKTNFMKKGKNYSIVTEKLKLQKN